MLRSKSREKCLGISLINAVTYIYLQKARPNSNNYTIDLDLTIGISKTDWVEKRSKTYSIPI